MRIEAADYADAAQERLSNARLLYEASQYSFALRGWCGGGIVAPSVYRAYEAKIRGGARFAFAIEKATTIINIGAAKWKQ